MTSVFIPISTGKKNITISNDCRIIDECDLFMWYVNSGKFGRKGFTKEKVDAVIRKHECEVDENDNVVKGNRRFKSLIVICFHIITRCLAF